MAKFELAFENTIAHEGFYANVSGDRGGETYQGIARKFHPHWQGWELVDWYKDTLNRELKNNEKIPLIELEGLVQSFYYEKFWQKIFGEHIKSQFLANAIFDLFVHSGSRGIEIVQEAINDLGKNILEDGVFGPVTLTTLNDLPEADLHDKINEYRKNFLIWLGRNEEQRKFVKGWLTRVNKFPELKKKA